ncbi:voltage-dependent N-type calcium channel subunit alpha-1B [Striga asiatica]|uniref:Voltage-dependent N-type calcium channel subunit alpha-1B n=1 Tax=Striga asiatica TaxID=4170 RepID=A0A5A7PXG0_STRAF|nr:voltage-dependent N-type calcium channel subunit alpha-1B [Striga asiatica]
MGSYSGLGIGLSVVFGCILMGLVAELYYLLWWKKKVAHNSTSSSPEIGDLESGQDPEKDGPSPMGYGEEEIVTELMRAHNLYGPPRFLFTIKEESREDLESENGKSWRKGSRTTSLNDLLLSSPTAKGLYGNPLFECLSEAELNKLRSSPPPKFKFLKDAEDKLLRKMLAEDNQTRKQ